MKLLPRHNRILQALRAGPMTVNQITARMGGRPHKALDSLIRAGLISLIDKAAEQTYHLTAAGLRACPPRNPDSARRQPPALATWPHLPQRGGRGRLTYAES